MKPVLRLALIVAFGLFVNGVHAQQSELSKSISVTVGPSMSTSVRLLNMPKGTRLAFVVQAAEPMWTLFMDEPNFKRFAQGTTALVTTRVARVISFSVQVPESGTYYLLLDNRENEATNRVNVQLKATPPAGTKLEVEPKPQLRQF